jgi:ADP-ribosylation factor GTPase-activating protein 2/3
MYFSRNAYDPSTVSEAQTRLEAFQGATAISSSAYFGRDEEEELGEGEGLLGDGNLAGLEVAARDVMTRVLSNPDVQNVGNSIRAGAMKVRTLCFPITPLHADNISIALRYSRTDV